jgi:uncharacterized protein (TIGR02271 family)
MYNDSAGNPRQSDLGAPGPMGQQFARGTSVYDVHGDKVGTVSAWDQQSNSMIIHKGLFFPKDIAVPMGAIARSNADGVYLNVTKHDVSSGNFGAAPTRGTQAAPTGTAADTGMRTRETTGEDIAAPVREEELQARKLQEEQGRVHLHRDVVEEQQTVSAPVTHEEVRVERQPVDRPADVPPEDWQEKHVEVPLRGEELTAEKRPRVSEEGHLEKQPVTDERQVSDTVRKEEAHLDVDGEDRPIQGATDEDQMYPPQQR